MSRSPPPPEREEREADGILRGSCYMLSGVKLEHEQWSCFVCLSLCNTAQNISPLGQRKTNEEGLGLYKHACIKITLLMILVLKVDINENIVKKRRAEG